MQYTSVEEKNAFYSAEQKQLCLVFEDGTVIDNEDIAMESMNLEQTLCDQDELRFGKVSSACFKTQINAVSIKRYRDLWFNVIIKAGKHERQLGRFRVYSDELTSDRKYREIVAYDAMYWAMNTDVTEWYNGLTFPLKQKAFRDSLFAYLGIEQEEVELPNDTIEIEKTVNAENFTGLTVLEALCEINAAWGVMNPMGQFKYVQMRTHEHDALYPSEALYPSDNLFPDDIYDDVLTKADYYQGSLKYTEYDTQPISKVTIRENADDIGYSHGTEGNTYVIEGNFLLYGAADDTLRTVAANFYSHANYIAYTPSEISCKGAPWREVGDLLKVYADGKTLSMPILRRQLSGITALTDVYAARGTEYYGENINGMSEQLKQLKGRTNVLTRTLDETRLEVSKFETDVNGQLEELSGSIELTAGAIELKVSKGDVVSEINQSPESVKIEAKNISLNGVVTANNNFEILEDGSMKAVNGTFEGRITAGTNSKIGGWTIDDGKIYGGDTSKGEKTAVMQRPDDGISWVFAAGGSSHSAYKDSPFRVSKSGNAVIRNLIIADALKIAVEDDTSGDVDEELYPDSISVIQVELTNEPVSISFGKKGHPLDVKSEIYFEEYAQADKDFFVNGALSVSGKSDLENVVATGLTSGNVGISGNAIWNTTNGITFKLSSNDDGYYMSTGTFRPKVQNKGEMTLGSSSAMWGQIYSTNSTISTSDRNVKDNISTIQEKYEELFSLLNPVTYTFKNGTSGRTHLGFISQDVEEAMTQSDLTSLDFAGFCKDIRTMADENDEGIAVAVLDENGNEQYDYALRYEEFIALNTHMIQKTIKDLNATKVELASLQEKYDALAAVVDTLKSKIE
mgnify:CR=1 FL=1